METTIMGGEGGKDTTTGPGFSFLHQERPAVVLLLLGCLHEYPLLKLCKKNAEGLYDLQPISCGVTSGWDSDFAQMRFRSTSFAQTPVTQHAFLKRPEPEQQQFSSNKQERSAYSLLTTMRHLFVDRDCDCFQKFLILKDETDEAIGFGGHAPHTHGKRKRKNKCDC